MDKRQIIIELFSGSPEAWTAEQLEKIESKTGESISRNELRRAYNVNKSILYREVSSALNKAIQEASNADFDGRLYILTADIIPALEALEEQRKHIEQLTESPKAYQAQPDRNGPES